MNVIWFSAHPYLLYTPRIDKQTNTDTDAIKTKSASLALLALKKITHNSMLVNPKKYLPSKQKQTKHEVRMFWAQLIFHLHKDVY